MKEIHRHLEENRLHICLLKSRRHIHVHLQEPDIVIITITWWMSLYTVKRRDVLGNLSTKGREKTRQRFWIPKPKRVNCQSRERWKNALRQNLWGIGKSSWPTISTVPNSILSCWLWKSVYIHALQKTRDMVFAFGILSRESQEISLEQLES